MYMHKLLANFCLHIDKRELQGKNKNLLCVEGDTFIRAKLTRVNIVTWNFQGLCLPI